MATKTDFKTVLDSYQARRGEFRMLEVPAMQYLMVAGQGDPNTSPTYSAALQALYPVAYKLKFLSRARDGRDYVVPPLEGLWWAEDMAAFTTARDKSQWEWTMMIMTPDWVDQSMLAEAVEAVAQKRQPDRLREVRLEQLTEGQCVQTLHVGPYDDETAVLEELHHHYIPERGLALTGTHHEIYLSDPRRTAPARLRTILRQPVINRE